jgi:hypothetical protein
MKDSQCDFQVLKLQEFEFFLAEEKGGFKISFH